MLVRKVLTTLFDSKEGGLIGFFVFGLWNYINLSYQLKTQVCTFLIYNLLG